jgi:hypothetical protein
VADYGYPTGPGSVNRPASTERETAEIETGAHATGMKIVLRLLENAGNYGMTWNEIAACTGWHHGKVSSRLTNLHKSGHVFALRQKRNRCHIYMDVRYREMYATEDVFDAPVRTKSSQKWEAYEAVVNAARKFVTSGDLESLINLELAVSETENL